MTEKKSGVGVTECYPGHYEVRLDDDREDMLYFTPDQLRDLYEQLGRVLGEVEPAGCCYLRRKGSKDHSVSCKRSKP